MDLMLFKQIIQGEKLYLKLTLIIIKVNLKIKRIEMEVLPSSQQVAAMKAGNMI